MEGAEGGGGAARAVWGSEAAAEAVTGEEEDASSASDEDSGEISEICGGVAFLGSAAALLDDGAIPAPLFPSAAFLFSARAKSIASSILFIMICASEFEPNAKTMLVSPGDTDNDSTGVFKEHTEMFAI